jgi:hypothetical protein
MAQNPDPPTQTFTKGVRLPDKRTVTVYAYDNGDVRIEVNGSPYVLSKCHLPEEGQMTEIRLSPGKQGSNVPKTSWKTF